MTSSYTALYSEETVQLKDMAYNKKNQSHYTNMRENNHETNKGI